MTDDEFDAALAESFASYDVAKSQADAEREHFENVYLPARIAQVEAKLSAQLPEGYAFKFDLAPEE